MIARFQYWDIHMTKAPFYELLEPFKGYPAGTSLSDYTLHKLGITIPLTPTMETYKKLVKEGQRCKHCWSESSCTHRIKEIA